LDINYLLVILELSYPGGLQKKIFFKMHAEKPIIFLIIQLLIFGINSSEPQFYCISSSSGISCTSSSAFRPCQARLLFHQLLVLRNFSFVLNFISCYSVSDLLEHLRTSLARLFLSPAPLESSIFAIYSAAAFVLL
jgi:hypothetical protein